MYRITGLICGVLLYFCISVLAWAENDPSSPWNPQNFQRTHQPVVCEDTCIRIDGNDHRLVDGVDLSGKNFFSMYVYHIDHVEGHPGWTELKNVSFSGSRFSQMYFADYDFSDCNFSRARIIDTYLGYDLHLCNFQDAWIENSLIGLSRKQLLSTANYKAKRFVGVHTGGLSRKSDYSGISFADFDLRYSIFAYCNLADCDFTDATIKGIEFGYDAAGLRIEQLLVTKDFKKGVVQGITLSAIFPKRVIDFSNMVFVDCQFWLQEHNVAKVDLTDSVISGCDFSAFQGLTLENIKSTWNYKHNRMTGIKLPESIQKALDAEKEKQ